MEQKKLGILISCRSVLDDDLFMKLNQLSKYSDIRLRINNCSNDPSDANKFYDHYKHYYNQPLPADIQFTVNIVNPNSEPTNADLRGHYNELNTKYCLLIDDDFKIKDFDKAYKDLMECVSYLDANPTCSIMRFKFDGASDSESLKFLYPILSTSLSCGLLVRTDIPIFDNKQLHMHWKSDDYTIVLNCLKQGYGIEVDNHQFIHCIKTKADEVVLPACVADTIPMIPGIKLSKTESGDIRYLMNSYDDCNSLCARSLLITKLTQLIGWDRSNGDPKIVMNANSSMLAGISNELDGDITILHARSIMDSGHIPDLSKYNILIVAAGTLSNDEDESINALHYNLNCIDRFIDSRLNNPGMIIYLGSTARLRGYPKHPYYSGNKSYLYNYLNSINVVNPNIMIHYLTIPSVESAMCDHGYDRRVIIRHIKLLINNGTINDQVVVSPKYGAD